jgi:tetratricopeptide (TPR) repeat protein
MTREAGSLNELGNLYNDMERWEDAAIFFRQAADIYVSLPDLNHEGVVRSNLTITLIKLQCYDNARVELRHAIECKKPFGHAAEPWKTWAVLFDLEQATHNPQTAAHARQQVIQSYLAYRRDRGESQTIGGKLCERITHAIQQGETATAEQELACYEGVDVPLSFKILLAKLHAILKGDRDPALANDPELYYADAAELQLLLEKLNAE